MNAHHNFDTADSHFLSELMPRILQSRAKHPVGPPQVSALLYYVQALQGHIEDNNLDGLREAAISVAAMAHRIGVESGKGVAR